MKAIIYSADKNEKLKSERGIGFEEIVDAITNGYLIKIVEHPNSKRYPNQKMFLVEINDYIYVAPFIEDKTALYLKTIFKSRKYTKKYLKKKL